MGQIKLAAEAFSAGPDACRTAAKVLANGRGDLNQPSPRDAMAPFILL
jgi:hypothetical protein